jgi:gliding motility-associated-like protein
LTVNIAPSVPIAPSGYAKQFFCTIPNEPKVSDLNAVGTSIKWYSEAIGGLVYPSTSILLDNTHYFASQTNASGCESSARLDVLVHLSSLTAFEKSITKPYCGHSDGKIVVTASNGIGNYNYVWNEGTVNDTISKISNGTYSVVVTDSIGCTSNLIFEISCKKGDIPQVISANGNGKNETWVIHADPKASVKIYNRWGSLVYSSLPYNDDWNGQTNEGVTLGNQGLPSGTYFYMIDNNDGEKPLSGYIELIK